MSKEEDFFLVDKENLQDNAKKDSIVEEARDERLDRIEKLLKNHDSLYKEAIEQQLILLKSDNKVRTSLLDLKEELIGIKGRNTENTDHLVKMKAFNHTHFNKIIDILSGLKRFGFFVVLAIFLAGVTLGIQYPHWKPYAKEIYTWSKAFMKGE